jgi:GTPase SAR1 family protein
MGLCASNENLTPEEQKQRDKDKARTKAFDKQITTSAEGDKAVRKLLLLGAGESGKSTIFKQTIKLYGSGFSDKEKKQYLAALHGNCVYAIKVLSKAATEVAKNGGRSILPENEAHARSIMEMKIEDNSEVQMNPQILASLKALWADPVINALWESHSQLQLSGSGKYFLDRLDIHTQPGYVPDDKDILAVRIRTTGIVQYRFTLQGHPFHIFDVGGQRTERRRWAHLFQEVTAVLFVAAISEYDQVLMEDEEVNRVTESLSLFDEIVHSQWFVNSSTMLFLNKSDLFKEKIQQKPLDTVYDDFKGPMTYEGQVSYMKKLFLSKNTENRNIYVHITCAIDPNNIKFVLDVVTAAIIKKALEGSGLNV